MCVCVCVCHTGVGHLTRLTRLTHLGLAYTQISNQGMAHLQVGIGPARCTTRPARTHTHTHARARARAHTHTHTGGASCSRANSSSCACMRHTCECMRVYSCFHVCLRVCACVCVCAQSFPALVYLNLDSCVISDAGCKVRADSMADTCAPKRSWARWGLAAKPGVLCVRLSLAVSETSAQPEESQPGRHRSAGKCTRAYAAVRAHMSFAM